MKEKILEALRGAKNHTLSGARLSEQLGCSRMAIWKHIEDLREKGYRIESLHGKGYRLVSEVDSMNPNDWQEPIPTRQIGRVTEYYPVVETTQAIAHQKAREGALHGTCIVADKQTGGKGRLGRSWHSPAGVGLWASFILRPSLPIEAVSQITLVMAAAVARTLAYFGYHPEIKWPNDLLLDGKKVCGILTELHGDLDQVRYLVTGIGINVDHREEDFSPEIRAIATSLYLQDAERKPKRHQLYFQLCKEIESLYQLFVDEGFTPIKILWESYALPFGRKIKVTTLKGSFFGNMKGITEKGLLLVTDEDGELHEIHSADIEICTD